MAKRCCSPTITGHLAAGLAGPSVGRGHQLALGLAEHLAPLGVVGAGGHGAAVEADGVADAADAAEEVAVVDEGLVAPLAVVVEGALEELGGAVVVAGAAVLDGGLVQDPVV